MCVIVNSARFVEKGIKIIGGENVNRGLFCPQSVGRVHRRGGRRRGAPRLLPPTAVWAGSLLPLRFSGRDVPHGARGRPPRPTLHSPHVPCPLQHLSPGQWLHSTSDTRYSVVQKSNCDVKFSFFLISESRLFGTVCLWIFVLFESIISKCKQCLSMFFNAGVE